MNLEANQTLQPHIAPHILRHYDIRGIYPTEINADVYYIFGQCFGTYIRQQGGQKVCVGYDGRLSSLELENALVQGLLATGITVYRLGCGPSPLIYYADRLLNTDGALMITGSHNPKDYNGLKLIVNHQPFFGQMIQDFGLRILQGQFSTGQGKAIQCDLNADYVQMLVDDFTSHYPTRHDLRIAWDPGNGAGGDIVTRLSQRLPGQHFVINATIDGNFPAHHPDPTEPENLQQLRQLVLEQQCDIGVAFDGDADRLGIVDDAGEFIWADQFMILFAQEILKTYSQATILADIKTSTYFFETVKKLGGKAVMVATGHSNIKQKIRETSALLAGEMSGHVFFADRYYGYDDALYAATRLLGIITSLPTKLSIWRQAYTPQSVRYNFKILSTPTQKQQILDHVQQKLVQDNISFIDIDGVRINTLNGWWLLRASNTQDLLIGCIEAQFETQLLTLKQQIATYLAGSGVDIKDLI